jgi:hypothetical protein
MPTRKQRKRRAKDRRHEYEYVYVDETGEEVEVDEDEAKAERTASRNGRAKPRQAAANPRIQPPSWRRVLKRGLLIAPLMFVTVMFIDQNLHWWQWLVLTAQLMLIFIPFSYFMDSLMWRRHTRRMGIEPAKKR